MFNVTYSPLSPSRNKNFLPLSVCEILCTKHAVVILVFKDEEELMHFCKQMSTEGFRSSSMFSSAKKQILRV